ncbi:MAG: cytochrome c family protein [Hyphomicrobiaceae bacterium]
MQPLHPTFAADAKQKVEKFVGANACAECHKDEAAVWKATHHFSTFRKMPRSKEARAIAGKLKIKRIKSDKLCTGCHFTQEKVRNRLKVTSGISCESCHGAGRDWEKLHSEFSGKGSKEAESKAEAATRWKQSTARGMIRPAALYKIAKNCYGCHVVPRERLVNVGGHPAGSPFELVSWSQGEVRHNVWYSEGKNNAKATNNRRRMMYITGLAVELETALRAIGVATERKDYAILMAHRANDARNKIAKVAALLSKFPELGNLVRLSHSAGLKLNNKAALSAAADKVAAEALRIVAKYDGSRFQVIDKLIPAPAAYKGTPAK